MAESSVWYVRQRMVSQSQLRVLMKTLLVLLVLFLAVPVFALDVNDISTANDLTREKQSIEDAMEVLNAGGRIVSMTVMVVPTGEHPAPPMGTIVPTSHIMYPPQMIDAIKSALMARETAIDSQLSQLGVTGTATRKK